MSDPFPPRGLNQNPFALLRLTGIGRQRLIDGLGDAEVLLRLPWGIWLVTASWLPLESLKCLSNRNDVQHSSAFLEFNGIYIYTPINVFQFK